VDAELKALFKYCVLGSLRVDVCREFGVHSVDDLRHLKPEDLDDLPNYLKDKLKAVEKRKLIAFVWIATIRICASPSEFVRLQSLVAIALQLAKYVMPTKYVNMVS